MQTAPVMQFIKFPTQLWWLHNLFAL